MSLPTLFLPPQACTQVAAELPVWQVDGDICSQRPFAEALPDAARAWRLVLPVEAVTVCLVQLPTTKGALAAEGSAVRRGGAAGRGRRAVPPERRWLLADGRHRVHAVRRAWLAGWLALCGSQPPQRIEVDADLLSEEGSQLLCLGERWLLGGSGEARLALRGEDWPQLAELCPSPRVARWRSARWRRRTLTRCKERSLRAAGLFGPPAGRVQPGPGAVRPSRAVRALVALASLAALLGLVAGAAGASTWPRAGTCSVRASATPRPARLCTASCSPRTKQAGSALRAQFDQHLAGRRAVASSNRCSCSTRLLRR